MMDPQQQAQHEPPIEFLLRTGKFREATWVLEKYVEHFPPEMGVFGNLAICHMMNGELPLAMNAAKKALEFDGSNPQLLEQLGRAAMSCGQYDEAIGAFRKLIEVNPAYTEGYALLGMCLRCKRRFDEAYEVYASFEKINGRSDVHVDSSVIFAQLMDGRTTPEQRQQTRQWWYDKHKAPWKFTSWPNNRDPDRPLRICYVSGDFRTHSAAYAFRPLITERDRANFSVALIGIEAMIDPLGQVFKDSADLWLHMPADNDEQIAWAVRNNEVDILVDLSGHTPGNRLRAFTTKPAPIAITMIGCIGSSGVPEIDYTIVDEGCVPAEETALFSETAINVPSALHFALPDYMPPVTASPCVENGYVTFGSFHHFSKISDETLQTWGKILKRVPNSRFFTKDDIVGDDLGRARLLKNLDIDPERIIREGTTGHEKHLVDHGRIDIALDSWPQGGGVTTCETIAMGVPVLSIAGPRIYQRGGASVARYLPDDAIITWSIGEYMDRAVALAKDTAWLESERFKRRDRFLASPFGDTKLWVKSIEDTYRAVWRKWCQG